MSRDIPLLGYCDKLSGRPGDVVAIKVSSQLTGNYEARLVRVVSADPNPDGPGMIEEASTTISRRCWGNVLNRFPV